MKTRNTRLLIGMSCLAGLIGRLGTAGMMSLTRSPARLSRRVGVILSSGMLLPALVLSTPLPAAHAAVALHVSGPAEAMAGQAIDLTVTAKDAYGNTVPGYAGKIAFSSSDSAAVLPSDYSFVAEDNGSRIFRATLNSGGGFAVVKAIDISSPLSPQAIDSIGAIAWWPFDEGAGTSTTDVAGDNGGTIIASGATVWAGGAPAIQYDNPAGLLFDGNDKIEAGSGVNLANRSFSLGVWAKRDIINSYLFIASQGTSDPNHALHIGFRGTNQFTCAFGSNDLNTPPYTDTDWHHWACTFDADSRARKIYRDGILVAGDTATANLQSTGVFHIGSIFDSSNYFRGRLDDLVVFGRVLSSDEIAIIASGQRLGQILGESGAIAVDDGVNPSATITYAPSRPYKSGDTVTITANFSEQLDEDNPPSIAIDGANTLAATAMTRVNATTYSYAYLVGPGDGAATISLAAGQDLFGNPVDATPTNGGSFIVDNTPPEAPVIDAPRDNDLLMGTAVVSGTAEANSTVKVFADAILAGSGAADAGGVWSFTVTLSHGLRLLTATATDAAGNTSPDSSEVAVDVDTVAPVLSISAPSSDFTGADPITYTVTYTGADTITLSPSDVTLTATDTASGTVSVSGSGTSERTVTISGMNGSGTLRISIAAGTAVDLAGNPAPAAGPGPLFFVCASGGITVTSAADSGAGTLRQAILDVSPGCTIDFNVPGPTPQTITLSSGELTITKDLRIAGPGADALTISGNNASRIFYVTSGKIAKLYRLTIFQGQSVDGGGIFNDNGTVTVADAKISDNTAAGNGGGIYSNYGSLTVSNTLISGNSSSGGSGGGIYLNRGSQTFADVTFSGNTAGSNSGGMHTYQATPNLTSVTFSGNTAGTSGGGMYYEWYAYPKLTNVTFSGNTAGYRGGGLYNGSRSSGELTNVTLRGNSAASEGGGIYYGADRSYSLKIRNAILWGNTAANQNGSQIRDGGTMVANSISDSIIQGGCSGDFCTNVSGSDPLLGVLGSYGGATLTIPLLAGSAAIDTGNSATCAAADQRGMARPQGAGCDIGAYEFVPTTATTVVSSLNPSVYGNSVTFTATVSDSEPARLPSGTVTFKNGGVAITGCIEVALSARSAACSLASLPPGLHAIIAAYSGDSSFNGSTAGSLTQTVDKVSQAITFGTLPAKTYGDASFTLAATASSGLPVSYASDNPEVATTTAEGLVQIVGAGSAILTTSQAGNVNYHAATPVPQSLMVHKSVAIVTLGSLTPTYDGTAKGATATTDPADLAVTFTYNGSPVPPTDTGSYAVIATISDANYQGTASGTLVINAYPSLFLQTPQDDFTTNEPHLTVNGTVNNVVVSITVNGHPVIISDGTFSTLVVLVEGTNTLTVVASDSDGNEVRQTRTITLDSIGPALTIVTPTANSATNQTSVTVSGTCDGADNVTVMANSGAAQAAEITGDTYIVNLLLSEGLHTLTVTATDALGNSSTQARTITVDLTAPDLAITLPAADTTVRAMPVTISGTVYDAFTEVGLLLTVNGQAVIPTVSGSTFGYQLAATDSGSFQVRAVATDAEDHSATVIRNIIYAPYGDANGDGSVDVADALLVLKMAVGLITPDLDRGDVAPLVNGKPQPDGRINAADALVILRRAIGALNW